MNGVLVVDKPSGPDLARRRRARAARRSADAAHRPHRHARSARDRRPAAASIGRATRLAQFLVDATRRNTSPTSGSARRRHLRRARRGHRRRRRPAGGRPRPVTVDLDGRWLAALLREFRGTFPQMPPPFSAKKIGGAPALRAGAAATRPSELKPVQVDRSASCELARRSTDGPRRTAAASRARAGFYVRSLAHDLGAAARVRRRTSRRCGGRGPGEFGAGRRRSTLDGSRRKGRERRPARADRTRCCPSSRRSSLTDEGARRAAHGNALAAEDLRRPNGRRQPAPGRAECGSWTPTGALLAIAEPARRRAFASPRRPGVKY